ncbi:amine sulfotransferase [Bombina bombina]|uniref:amine sulfotransferase n=1 Tax=Bombina bombina TaxID=8345 RepID=UPI00235AFCB4|nr:amine sulfotransferase [Bombina bombina]XP_053566780.1 amine sulfotransferase [Bombina bombina]XP_053566781.1 amine sulfotransferase [Bombina bombina]XP_053566782.1 amine sulfotransferase [Bombina bombina]
MAATTPVLSDPNLYRHRGACFPTALITPEYIDSLEDFKIRVSDVFLATYPKSGTVWTQQILSLIYSEEHRNESSNLFTSDRVPWIEFNIKNIDFESSPSPRLFATHLPYSLVPKDLRNKIGKVIYVIRNPKDVMNSLYHFEPVLKHIQKSPSFEYLMEKMLKGDVFPNSWFDHVRGWYANRNDFNILFLKYEDMVMDLRSTVVQICKFLGKELDDKSLDAVVKRATFKNMKTDPLANKENDSNNYINKDKGSFMRKGTIGDWKNIMTVAQSEKFDNIFEEKMKDVPLSFTWELPEK